MLDLYTHVLILTYTPPHCHTANNLSNLPQNERVQSPRLTPDCVHNCSPPYQRKVLLLCFLSSSCGCSSHNTTLCATLLVRREKIGSYTWKRVGPPPNMTRFFHTFIFTFSLLHWTARCCPSRFFLIRKVYLDPLRFPFLHPGSASSPSAPASLAGFLCKKKLTAPLKSAAMTRLRDANYALWAKQGGDWGIVHSTITESLPFNKQIWMHQLYCLCYYVQLLLFCCANWRSYVEKRRCGTLLYIISL